MNSLCNIFAVGFLVFLAHQSTEAKPTVCYSGQSYWCKNITTAAECNAVKHCIHSVWEKEVPIEMDKSSVCQTCMDMVKLARDQLESNETQEELKQVLEGTCMVIPEKHLRNDCDKLMDDFGSYLVDTLASQMNPSTVCAVAGLCYSDKFKNVKVMTPLNCDNCNGLVKQIERNIETASTSDLKQVVSKVCRSLGSFYEVCASLIEEHMESLDALIRNNVRAGPVCDLAGVCAEKYHSHARQVIAHQVPAEVEVFSPTPSNDDLPCELCEQLVQHLRDVLIANTTEEEFKMVLEGLCKMSKFKDECGPFIDQYYAAVYDFLVNELDGKMLCTQIQICNVSKKVSSSELVTEQLQPLPLDRMKLTLMPQHLMMNQKPKSGPVCSFCEYFLHFVQESITLPSSEKQLTQFFEGVCNRMPGTIRSQCDSFVDAYLPDFIAILANKVDPSIVCPSLGVCSGVLMAVETKDKPTCPLCLLAFEEALKKVHGNRSETVIGDVLDDICMRDEFPTSVLVECAKFITGFKGPITDMIIADFTSQEACVYVDLCSPPQDLSLPPPATEGNSFPHVGDVETNEINEHGNPNACVLCEFIMEKLTKMIADKKTEEEIKQALLNVCGHLPKTVSPQCKTFINEYGDMIMNLIVSGATPKIVCTELELCVTQVQIMNPIKRCVVCEIFMDFLKTVLTNEEIDTTLNDKMMKACDQFPRHEIQMCKSMVMQLGPQIESIIRAVPVGPLACRHLQMCPNDRIAQELQFGPGCHSGAEYWCATSAKAVECDKIEYCQTNVWRSEKPGRRMLKGSDIFSH